MQSVLPRFYDRKGIVRFHPQMFQKIVKKTALLWKVGDLTEEDGRSRHSEAQNWRLRGQMQMIEQEYRRGQAQVA
jgi:hypothetical protein